MPRNSSTSKLKIGLVLDTSLDPMDGVQQYVVVVGEWLRSQGHEVHYLVGETKERDLPNIHSLARNIGVTFNGNKTTIPLPTNRHALRAFMRREQFDVLHVQTPHHPFLAQRLILAADPTTVVVGTFHILPYSRMVRIATRLLGVWLRPSLKRFNTMLAVSPAAATFEKQTFGLDAQVLPNVFEQQRFAAAMPRQQYDDDTLTILFLGRLVPRKGCRYLLEAIAQLDHSQLPKFRVIVCGKGPLLAELQEYTAAHGLETIVEFVGFVSEADKPGYYASADIAVFPSTGGESFGIVLLEAMASGRAAVIAGDNAGYRSVLGSCPEDVLFTPDDPAQIAAMLTKLLRDQAYRQRIAAWQKTFAADFDVAVVGPQLVKVYRGIAATE